MPASWSIKITSIISGSCLVPRRRYISPVNGGKTGTAGLDGFALVHKSSRTAHDQRETPGDEADLVLFFGVDLFHAYVECPLHLSMKTSLQTKCK